MSSSPMGIIAAAAPSSNPPQLRQQHCGGGGGHGTVLTLMPSAVSLNGTFSTFSSSSSPPMAFGINEAERHRKETEMPHKADAPVQSSAEAETAANHQRHQKQPEMMEEEEEAVEDEAQFPDTPPPELIAVGNWRPTSIGTGQQEEEDAMHAENMPPAQPAQLLLFQQLLAATAEAQQLLQSSQSQQEQQMQLFPGATMAIGPTPTAFAATQLNPAQYPSLIGGINSSSSSATSPPLPLTAQSFLLSEAFNAAMATIQQQQQQPSQTMEVTQAILAEMAAIAQQQQRQQEAAQMEERNKLRQSNLSISENVAAEFLLNSPLPPLTLMPTLMQFNHNNHNGNNGNNGIVHHRHSPVAASSSAEPRDILQQQHGQSPGKRRMSPSGGGIGQQMASSTRPVRSQRAPMKEIITLDDPNELDEFMCRGEEACIQDMRSFITQFSLRQTTVAMMTGVSQPYISKLLNGNHRELSLRCRKNIYCWYLNCRRHPEKLAMFVQDPSSRLETTPEGELVPQRRERYVFRPVLLRILEAYFEQSPFPDTGKRVEIANACNANLQIDKKNNQLMPKEVVTPQVVANWFANKRKEIRRKNQRGGGRGSAQRTAANQQQQSLAQMPAQQFANGHMANHSAGELFASSHGVAPMALSSHCGVPSSSSAASCASASSSSGASSTFSPTPPSSATFPQHQQMATMFPSSTVVNGENGGNANEHGIATNLATILEELQNQQQQQLNFEMMLSRGSKSVEEILLGQRQTLLLPNLLQSIQQQQQQQQASHKNSSSFGTSSLFQFPPPAQIHSPPANLSPRADQMLLLQHQHQLHPPQLSPNLVSNNAASMNHPLLALQQQLASALSTILSQQPQQQQASALANASNELAALQAAKLMENTAALAAQNPQLLARLVGTD